MRRSTTRDETSVAVRRLPRRGAVTAALTLAVALTLGGCSWNADGIDAPYSIALVYGVADYAGVNSLIATYDDAVEMAGAFLADGWNEVRLRIDDGFPNADQIARNPIPEELVFPPLPATINQLQSDIEDVATLATQGLPIRLLFFFAGHGADYSALSAFLRYEGMPEIYDEDSFVIVMSDQAGSVTFDVQDAMVDVDALAQIIGRANALETTIILDSCNSGGFVPAAQRGIVVEDLVYYDGDYGVYDDLNLSPFSASAAVRTYFGASEATVGDGSVFVFAAAGAHEDAQEITSQNGVVTGHLLESRTHGDQDDDGWVTTTEAFSYVVAAMNGDGGWNQDSHPTYAYLPRISAGPTESVLFRAVPAE